MPTRDEDSGTATIITRPRMGRVRMAMAGGRIVAGKALTERIGPTGENIMSVIADVHRCTLVILT
jgi:hypothetical protein